MTDHDAEYRERIRRGRLTTKYLADKDLMFYFEEQKALLSELMFESEMGETAKREGIYFMRRGLQDILDAMEIEANFVRDEDEKVRAEGEKARSGNVNN